MQPRNISTATDTLDPVRAPAGTQIANDAAALAQRALVLASRTNEKLHPVMMVAPPAGSATATMLKDAPSYPPLFAELRISLDMIADALDAIDDALTRTEV